MSIAIQTLRALAQTIVMPSYLFTLVIIMIMFYIKNRKISFMQKMIIGQDIESPLELTLSQVTLSIIAGALGSVILAYLGVAFQDNSSIVLLFLISIILTFAGSRFICFSYSGAVLGVASVAVQFLAANNMINVNSVKFLEVDVVMLMSLVGVLHIIEGILVMFDGKSGAIPVFTNRNNKIIGGFAFKRYWILPVTLFIIINSPNLNGTVNVATPGFWPLIRTNLTDIAKNVVMSFAVFYGVIGYKSVTFTKTKRKKALTSGLGVALYGLILLGLAQVLKYNLVEQLVLAILAPLMHETMLRLEAYSELKGEPKFISDDGIMVLEVAPNSPAKEMGIKSGDLVLEINDTKILTEEDISKSIQNVSTYVWLKIKDVQGKLNEVSYNKFDRNKKLGLVFVPKDMPKESKVVKFDHKNFDDVLDDATKNDEKQDENEKDDNKKM
ncbi:MULTISPECIES: PDZ domain-containing protein [Clostridium]|uniref:PDZ domain-containing protein n=1 Tax=Clostridium TaxID=1485 RepID=UPI00082446B1|nr:MULTISPECIES: PDZ domain-containing protein [Clostridium]PJI07847.1 PDZ domain-containing protein [Clostridium sp. CT7]